MTNQEKIELAQREVEQAEIMLRETRKQVVEWQNKVDLRTETLNRLISKKDKI